MDIELTGMSEMLAKLERLRTELPTTEMRKAVRAGANVIRDAFEEAAPILDRKTAESTSLEPGAVKEGMRVKMSPPGEEIEAEIGPGAKTEHVVLWLEGGHRNVKGGYNKITATGTRGPGHALESETPPHPFERAAFEASLADAEEAMKASLGRSIEELTR
jgi:HK97 gp10 family phage protein